MWAPTSLCWVHLSLFLCCCCFFFKRKVVIYTCNCMVTVIIFYRRTRLLWSHSPSWSNFVTLPINGVMTHFQARQICVTWNIFCRWLLTLKNTRKVVELNASQLRLDIRNEPISCFNDLCFLKSKIVNYSIKHWLHCCSAHVTELISFQDPHAWAAETRDGQQWRVGGARLCLQTMGHALPPPPRFIPCRVFRRPCPQDVLQNESTVTKLIPLSLF